MTQTVTVTELLRRRLRALRDREGLTAQALADRCAQLGVAIDRNAIASFESGRRSKLSVEEFAGLAMALATGSDSSTGFFGELLLTGEDVRVEIGDVSFGARDWERWVTHDFGLEFDAASPTDPHLIPLRMTEEQAEQAERLWRELRQLTTGRPIPEDRDDAK